MVIIAVHTAALFDAIFKKHTNALIYELLNGIRCCLSRKFVLVTIANGYFHDKKLGFLIFDH